MIKVENIETYGIEAAIRGMRNPMNSWDRSDSGECNAESCFACMLSGGECGKYMIGPNDLDLMKRLLKAGPEHRKYLRMITVTMDIIAPLYWWKEFDTYKVGTVCNSCSTMHKIHSKEFSADDFSCEHLNGFGLSTLWNIIDTLNLCRNKFLLTKDKGWWWQMIQILPSSYNQRRTVQLNYEVALNMINQRENHKLDEWRELVDILKDLPYMKELRE